MPVVCSTAGEVHSDLGANHHMWTYADLYDNDWIAGRTRTASFTWFGGFVRTIACAFVGAQNRGVGTTGQLAVWVNGTAGGGSEKARPWSPPLPRRGPTAG